MSTTALVCKTKPTYTPEFRALDQRLRGYAKHRAALEAAEAFDLVRAEQLKLHIYYGCATFWEYLERALGYRPHAARERMRVARALVELPATSARLARGEVTYSAVRELTRVATANTEDEWLAKTAEMTTHEIEREVAGHVRGDLPGDPKHADLRRRKVRLEMTTEVYALWRQTRVALERELGHELGELELVEIMCRRVLDPGSGAAGPAHQIAYKQCNDCKRATQNGGGLELDIEDCVIERAHCDARLIGSVDAPAPERATTTVTPRIREQVFVRASFCCQVPGCRSRRNLEIHHIHAQAHGGGHELSNLVVLCGGHHAALHTGLIEISGESPFPKVRWTYFTPLPVADEAARARVVAERDRAEAWAVPKRKRRNPE